MFSSTLLATILINPMLPTQVAPTSAPEAAVSVQRNYRPVRLDLNDVYLLGQRKRAQLNGKWYEESDWVNGWQIKEIRFNGVRLSKQNQEKVLTIESNASAFSPTKEHGDEK